MSITRDRTRIQQTGEHFTPAELTEELLDSLPAAFWNSREVKILEPAAGEGAMLQVAIERFTHGDIAHCLTNQIYAVELMPDNCAELQRQCIARWGMPIRHLVCADALTYSMQFKEEELWNE